MRDGTETRAGIQRTALRLFVEKGINGTTTRDIAEGAGIAEGTLYRHYAGKEELAWALLSDNLKTFAAGLDAIRRANKHLREQNAAMIRRFFAFFDEDPVLFRYLVLTPHELLRRAIKELRDPFDVIRDAIDAGMARGDIPKRDVTLMASLAYGLVRQVAVSHAQGRAKGKLADRAEPVAAASWLVLSAAAPKPKAKKPLDRR